MRLQVEKYALLDVPVYESHKRGRNWLAKIELDPESPGGLRREFLPYARGDYYYVIKDLKVGDAVEFGADYYTTSGRKCPKRWYGVVTKIELDENGNGFIELKEAEDAREACELAEEVSK